MHTIRVEKRAGRQWPWVLSLFAATTGLACGAGDSTDQPMAMAQPTSAALVTETAAIGEPIGPAGQPSGTSPPSSQAAALRSRNATPRIAATRTGAGGGPAASVSPGGSAIVGAAGVNQTIRTGNGIAYSGDHVMTGAVTVYYIWYGAWSQNSATSILTDLVSNLGGSPYWGMNTLYDDRFGGHVSNQVKLGGATTDSYSQGSVVDRGGVLNVVNAAIAQHRLPKDANGVYFVLTSADVNQSGDFGSFCQNFCGWHDVDYTTDIKYAFVGNGDRCPDKCGLPVTGPNNNQGADAMASVISHELAETVTDP